MEYFCQCRKLNTLSIPFEPEGGGKDIGWMFGYLDSEEDIALTPEKIAQYIAYKLIIQIVTREKAIIFNEEG